MNSINCILLVIFWLSSTGSCDLPYLPSVGSMGSGYDLVKGNPKNDHFDPGILFPISQFSEYVPTPDHRYLVPKEVSAQIWPDCSFDSTYSFIHSSSDYFNSLTVDVSADFKLWTFAFSASTDYKNVEKITKDDLEKVSTTEALCTYYRLQLEYLYTPLNFTDDFKGGVQQLSTNMNDSASYQQFISYFGTHVITKGTFGSKFFIRSTFDQSSWDKFSETNYSIEASASAAMLFWSGDLSALTDKEKKMAEAYDSIRTEDYYIYIGSLPPQTGRWQDWANLSVSSPAIVQYTLVPMTDFMTSNNFPDVKNIDDVKSFLNIELGKYCSNVPGCQVPQTPNPQSCRDLKLQGNTKDGVYTLYFNGLSSDSFEVYCRNMDSDLNPLDYIPINGTGNEVNFYYLPMKAQDCALEETITYSYVPIDPLSLNIRPGDDFGEVKKGNGGGIDFGTVSTAFSGYNFYCTNCGGYEQTLSLQGTKFAWDDSYSAYDKGTYSFEDQYDQVLKVKAPVVTYSDTNDCVNAFKSGYVEYGLSRLKYIGF